MRTYVKYLIRVNIGIDTVGLNMRAKKYRYINEI